MNKDKSTVYEQLLRQAQNDKKEALESKKWSVVAKIEVKIADLENILNKK